MIFGNAAPKFQVSATDVLLDYAVIEVDEIDYGNKLHESELARARSFQTHPRHHTFQVLIHLHRYQSPKAKYDEIVQHLNATVQLWRHRDGQAFQDTGSADADFIFIEYQRLYITTTDYADGLRLKFQSLETIDHTDFGDNWTFARALTSAVSNAWYLHHTTGLMTAAADTTTARRLVAGKYKGTALAMEGAATNVITHPSGPYDAGSWTDLNCTCTADTTETLDPKGTNTADKLAATAGNGSVVYTSSTAVGNDVAASVWLKCPTGTVAGFIQLKGTGGGSDSEAFLATHEWQKFSITADTSGYTTNLTFDIIITTNTEIVYAWGAGMYDSSEFAPTIPDPIATASKTRATEEITILSANTDMTKLKGTISMWVRPYWTATSTPKTFGMLFEAGDAAGAAGNTTHRLYFGGSGSQDRLVLIVKGDNADTKRIDYTPAVATGLTVNTWTHVVATWDSTVSNGGHIYVNGSELSTGSSNSAFNVSDLNDTIAIGSQLDGTIPFDGEIDELFIDTEVWTAAKVAAVYNLPNGIDRTLEFK